MIFFLTKVFRSKLKNQLTLLLLCCFAFLASSAQQKIPIDILKSGHIVLDAKVNGVPGKFIFDTGAGITMLTKNFADKLQHVHKLDGTLSAFRATGERLNMDLYNIDSLNIGSLTEKRPTITVIDVDLQNYDGIISLMPFQKQAITIDFKKKLLVLESKRSLQERSSGKKVHLQFDRQRDLTLDVFARFLLNGRKNLQFLLDSGAGKNSFWINASYLSSCDIDTTDTAKVEKIVRKSDFNPSAKSIFYKAVVPELSLADCSLIKHKDFKATFTSSLIYDGKVSIQWLGECLTFDLKNKLLIVNNP